MSKESLSSRNSNGYVQVFDNSGEEVCAECGISYVNLGNGIYCKSCRIEHKKWYDGLRKEAQAA